MALLSRFLWSLSANPFAPCLVFCSLTPPPLPCCVRTGVFGGGGKVSVMGVLTLLLGHELDGQIDKVLWLAQKYDEDANAFHFRYITDVMTVVLAQ